jgi:hypothetical protein
LLLSRDADVKAQGIMAAHAPGAYSPGHADIDRLLWNTG